MGNKKPKPIHIEILVCPNGHGTMAVSIDDTRITPDKCCGMWRALKQWDVTDLKTYADGFKSGVEAAAGIADMFNSESRHPFRLGDLILCKLNQTKMKKPRRNKWRL